MLPAGTAVAEGAGAREHATHQHGIPGQRSHGPDAYGAGTYTRGPGDRAVSGYAVPEPAVSGYAVPEPAASGYAVPERGLGVRSLGICGLGVRSLGFGV